MCVLVSILMANDYFAFVFILVQEPSCIKSEWMSQTGWVTAFADLRLVFFFSNTGKQFLYNKIKCVTQKIM